MTNATLQAILEKYVIHPAFWPGMQALTFYGVRPGDELLRRLRQVRRFRQCLKAILAELSNRPASRYRKAG